VCPHGNHFGWDNLSARKQGEKGLCFERDFMYGGVRLGLLGRCSSPRPTLIRIEKGQTLEPHVIRRPPLRTGPLKKGLPLRATGPVTEKLPLRARPGSAIRKAPAPSKGGGRMVIGVAKNIEQWGRHTAPSRRKTEARSILERHTCWVPCRESEKPGK